MSFDQREKVAQNLNGSIPSPQFQLLTPHQLLQNGGPMMSLCASMPPMNAAALTPNRTPVYHNQFFSHQKPLMQSNFEQCSQDALISDPEASYCRKGSPLRVGIPLKRHRLNEESNSMQSDSSNGSFENVNSLQVDGLFYELQCFAYEGSLFAENVAKNYRKRPCFKKIELLLSRLRQELNVQHNIMSNINSQGTAWAIKDFVFVFSRIVNAWIIIRGYFYDKTEGLDDLRKEFDPNLFDAFTQWQEATLKMMKTMMGTVENIDILTQNKSGRKQKKKEVYVNLDSDVKQYDKAFLENFQKKLFEPKFVENSEEIQVRNHQTRQYFRAGVLKPLKIPANESPNSSAFSPILTPSTPDSEMLNWISYEDLNEIGIKYTPIQNTDRLYNRKSLSLPVTPLEQTNPFDNFYKSRAKKDLSSKFNSMAQCNEVELEKRFGNLEMTIENNGENIGDSDEEKLTKIYKKDGRKIVYLINEVGKITCYDGFSMCVNMIIENVKNGKYASIDGILDEFKVLISYAKGMAERSKDDGEKTLMTKFIINLEALVNRKAFE